MNARKHVFPRLFAFLRSGVYGTTATTTSSSNASGSSGVAAAMSNSIALSYSSCLPLLSLLPPEHILSLEFSQEFLGNLWKGLETEHISQQASHVGYLVAAYMECMKYFIAQARYGTLHSVVCACACVDVNIVCACVENLVSKTLPLVLAWK